jgi:hypothetical protein
MTITTDVFMEEYYAFRGGKSLSPLRRLFNWRQTGGKAMSRAQIALFLVTEKCCGFKRSRCRKTARASVNRPSGDRERRRNTHPGCPPDAGLDPVAFTREWDGMDVERIGSPLASPQRRTKPDPVVIEIDVHGLAHPIVVS